MERLSISWMLCVLLFGLSTDAAPAITFPLNSQVPPAARVGELFTFEFSPTTFSSDSPITYSLANHPAWLSVDSGARRLYGTPRNEDVGPDQISGVPIELVAADATGATTLSATLVVSRNPAPKVEVPLSEQIANFGPYTEPGSILEYPGKSFSFVFAPNTFSSKELDLYAVSGNNSPLPAWISFDPSKLTFTGTTPPLASLIDPPQLFDFQLLASDVTGFSAAGIAFSIIVGNHELTVENHNITINATAGLPLSYIGLVGNVKIDGKTASPSDVASASIQNAPSWISFDPATWAISGTPPSDAVDSSFSVIFTDSFHDTANVTVKIDLTSKMFKDDFPELKIRRGDKLFFDLKPHLSKPEDVEVKFDVQPAQEWLRYDAANLTLTGDVPKDLKSDSIDVSFQITSKTTKEVETQTLKMGILAATAPSTSGTSSATNSSPTSTSTGDKGATAAAKDSTGIRTILLAVMIPTLLLLIAILVIFCCWCRKRRRRLSQRLARREITGPQPGGLSFNENGDSNPSLKAAKAQYDIGAAATLPVRGEKGKAVDVKGLRRSRTNPGTPPVPRIPPLTGPGGIRSFGKSSFLASPSSWFGTKQKPSHGKSFLSDGSIYDDDNASLNLLMHSKEGADFRSSLLANPPPKDPPSSIQHTPDLAYGTTPPPQRPIAASLGSHRPVPGRTLRRSHQTIDGILAHSRLSTSPEEAPTAVPLPLSRPRSRASNRPSDASAATRRSYRPTSKPPQLPYPYRDPYPAITPERRVSHLADPFVSSPPSQPAPRPTNPTTAKRASRATGEPVVNRPRAAFVRRPVSRRGDHPGLFAGRGLDSPSTSSKHDGSPLSTRKGKLSVAESWALKKQRASRDREHRARMSRGGAEEVGRDSLGINHGRRGDGASERSWVTSSGQEGTGGEETTPEIEQAEVVEVRSEERGARANWRVVRSVSPVRVGEGVEKGVRRNVLRVSAEGGRTVRTSARSGMLGEELVVSGESEGEMAVGTAVSRYSKASGRVSPSVISADEGYQENASSVGGRPRVVSGASSAGGRSDGEYRVYI